VVLICIETSDVVKQRQMPGLDCLNDIQLSQVVTNFMVGDQSREVDSKYVLKACSTGQMHQVPPHA